METNEARASDGLMILDSQLRGMISNYDLLVNIEDINGRVRIIIKTGKKDDNPSIAECKKDANIINLVASNLINRKLDIERNMEQSKSRELLKG